MATMAQELPFGKLKIVISRIWARKDYLISRWGVEAGRVSHDVVRNEKTGAWKAFRIYIG